MLENPVTMPEFGKHKRKNDPKRKILSKGNPYSHKLKQKPLSKHRQPSIYVETKVEKRKS